MSTAIKEKFLSTWDKELTDAWKHIIPILAEVRIRSGNDAAATLCTFSKNWRTNKAEIRKTYDLGVKQKENDAKEDNEEDEDKIMEKDGRTDNKKDHNSSEEKSSEDAHEHEKKTSKESNNKKNARSKQQQQESANQSQHPASIVYSRPLSPIRSRRSNSSSTVPRVLQTNKPKSRPKSSKSRSSFQQYQSLQHGGGGDSGSYGAPFMTSSMKSGLNDPDGGDAEEVRACKERIEELEQRIQDIQGEHDEMEHKIKQQDADKARLIDRIVELNEVKVANDEQELQLQFVAERNSPLKVVQEFEMLWNNEWADAKQALDEYSDWKVHDKDKYEILNSALLECMQAAEEAYTNHRAVLVKLLNDPFAAARHPGRLRKRLSSESAANDAENNNNMETQSQATTHVSHKAELSPELEEAVLKYMKVQCDAIDTRHTSRYVIANAFATLHPLLVDHDLVKSARVKHFVRAALQLSWKMVIQSPPLKFDFLEVGGTYDESKQELHQSSEAADTEGVVIDYVIYPCVTHGDKTMQKALVSLASPPSDNEEAASSGSVD